MKQSTFFLLLFLSYSFMKCGNEKQEEINERYCDKDIITDTHSGIYKGKSLFVQNPVTTTGHECVLEVSVNEITRTNSVSGSCFEIEMDDYVSVIGESVTVKIKHLGCCTPKILNPEVIMPDKIRQKQK